MLSKQLFFFPCFQGVNFSRDQGVNLKWPRGVSFIWPKGVSLRGFSNYNRQTYYYCLIYI